ncbi:hypothetical protein SSS_09742 [Sarcoptes scabiei]|nr:hypothetical protein SSS_09742 [Sarcoptes scabiei]
MPIDFDLGRDKITTGSQCQNAFHFERCLKRLLFESEQIESRKNLSTVNESSASIHESHDTNRCSFESKEIALQIILGSIKWNLGQSSSLPCHLRRIHNNNHNRNNRRNHRIVYHRSVSNFVTVGHARIIFSVFTKQSTMIYGIVRNVLPMIYVWISEIF